MGMATFNGRHNRRKACVLFVLYRFECVYPNGKGLTSSELRELLGLKPANVCEALARLHKFHYIGMGLTPSATTRMRIYTINMKGSTWLHRWAAIVPWDAYGWDAAKLAEIDKAIRETVQFRGYE